MRSNSFWRALAWLFGAPCSPPDNPRVQVIHFVRHGEGFHNIGIVNEDAHLTAAGWKQAHALRKHISSVRPALNVEVSCCIARLRLNQLLPGSQQS